jgi:hypothetical protein
VGRLASGVPKILEAKKRETLRRMRRSLSPDTRIIFYAIGTSGNLIELDRQTTSFHFKVKPLPGYATAKTIAELKPAHAAVRINVNATQFVVRGRAPIDPSSRYELWLLRTARNHRELAMAEGHASILSASGTSKLDENAIPLQFDDYGGNSYRITPGHPLAPGEYAIALRGLVSELYCFGVDP